MKVKIFKNGNVSYNFVAFALVSLLYLYVLTCLDQDKTALNLANLKLFGLKNYIVLGLFLLSSYFALKLHRLALVFSTIYFVAINYLVIHLLVGNLNKLILFMLFIHIVCVFYYLIFLKTEIEEAGYNPRYNLNQLDENLKLLIRVVIKLENSEVEEFGHLTNWDANGCFIKLDRPQKFKRSKVKILVDFSGRQFMSSGRISALARDKSGIGVIFEQSSSNNFANFGWKDLYSILYNTGYLPEYLT